MTRSVLLFLLALLFHVSCAWVVLPVQQSRASMPSCMTTRFLHPDQAKELEECAFDLMKQALEEEQALKKEGVLSGKAGPLAWCWKHLPGRAWWMAHHPNKSTALKP